MSTPGVGPERQGDVQITRRVFQQQIDQPDRARWQAIDLVERQQAGSSVPFDRAGQYAHLLDRWRGGPVVVRPEQTEIQSRLLERERQVAAKEIGRILVAQ